jgi:ABC-type transport system involved in multi-copper enzyme maturation permease subunit
MSLAQVIKTELYKSSRRKSSLMLFIPMLLAIIVTFGYAHGVIDLNLTTKGMRVYSCMDFIFIVWNVLSGLGIIGIVLLLFAAFQFSGEIDCGQVKLMLLRIGKRSTVVFGKYLATVIASVVSIIVTFVICIVSYYMFVATTAMGTGTFASTIDGLSSLAICEIIGLQILMYLLLISITFLVGLFANPFITFVLAIVVMYIGNYLAGSENMISKLLPVYWSNQLMLNETVSAIWMSSSVCITCILIVFIMVMASLIFQRQDVK